MTATALPRRPRGGAEAPTKARENHVTTVVLATEFGIVIEVGIELRVRITPQIRDFKPAQ